MAGGRMGTRWPPRAAATCGQGGFLAKLSPHRAPPQRGGNFVRLNLKKKSYVRGYALRGNRLRKQVTSLFGGCLGTASMSQGIAKSLPPDRTVLFSCFHHQTHFQSNLSSSGPG